MLGESQGKCGRSSVFLKSLHAAPASSPAAGTSPGTWHRPGPWGSSAWALVALRQEPWVAISEQSCHHRLVTSAEEGGRGRGGRGAPARPLCHWSTWAEGQQLSEGPARWASWAGSARAQVHWTQPGLLPRSARWRCHCCSAPRGAEARRGRLSHADASLTCSRFTHGPLSVQCFRK